MWPIRSGHPICPCPSVPATVGKSVRLFVYNKIAVPGTVGTADLERRLGQIASPWRWKRPRFCISCTCEPVYVVPACTSKRSPEELEPSHRAASSCQDKRGESTIVIRLLVP